MTKIYYIIKRPIITKKSTSLMKQKKLSFEVCENATKKHIKRAFNIIFKVNVKNIKTLIIRGKKKRINKSWGREKNIKKAIVAFTKTQDIKKITNWSK